MLLASTNDLASRNENPELLIKTLDDQITELKRFSNLCHNTEEFLTVVDSIPPEFNFYYEDGLHFSNVGFSKSCSILLSTLYRAPDH